MAFVKVCSLAELEPRGIASFHVDGLEVMVLRDHQGVLRAFHGLCPHEDNALVDGFFDGSTITCAYHGWILDASTGRGINPPGCRIDAYPLKLEGDEVHVDLDTTLP
jgi:toluene monooxygenase system ferredoxin subunit